VTVAAGYENPLGATRLAAKISDYFGEVHLGVEGKGKGRNNEGRR